MNDNFTDTELTNEVWRDIDGYDGMYQVSDLGRVRSNKYGDWRVLRPKTNGIGYLIVDLYRDRKMKHFYVHRLVASAFIENDSIFNTEINHINEDKTDNRVENLEWCDRSYNLTYNGLQHRRTANYHRSNYKRDKIKNLYRPDLSIKQNIALFKENGIECCERTVYELRRDLGIARKYTKRS